ncbi:hypothetical protein DERF_006875 [Dermatophagoides farinae]|uniref:Uncharacterized protein n=1 Tax=Dermatophagoides farinae TaxID=6954 RepID=A0A922I080_DERFA|nr:hypothetical protein DERF_006875 [Dermatophagoides farinae]
MFVTLTIIDVSLTARSAAELVNSWEHCMETVSLLLVKILVVHNDDDGRSTSWRSLLLPLFIAGAAGVDDDKLIDTEEKT